MQHFDSFLKKKEEDFTREDLSGRYLNNGQFVRKAHHIKKSQIHKATSHLFGTNLKKLNFEKKNSFVFLQFKEQIVNETQTFSVNRTFEKTLALY